MEINLLKINGFGKLNNKEINLDKKINIIYGKNEQGKTTTLKFINSMLYGTSKNKNGKDISDFDKYKPWNNENYSGKIVYTLDNHEQFEIYREFNKKNPKIFNSNKEDISKEFKVDLKKGIQFFEEQTGITEDVFNSSTLVGQNEITMDETERRNIVQKISNLYTTGEENISYKKTIDKLNKKFIEEVGTDRTTDRPLNILNEKIDEINNKIKNITNNEENIINIKNKKILLKNEIKNTENKKILLKEIKEIKNKLNNKNEEIKIKNNLIEENKNKINELENNLENNIKLNKIKNKKINSIIYLINLFVLLFEIINIILKINIKIKIFISIILLLIPLIIIFIYFKNKNIRKNIKNNFLNINNEKIILNKMIKDLEENISYLNKEKINEEENEKNKIIKKYNNIFQENKINNYFNNELNILEENIKKIEEENNNLNFQKYQMEVEEKNIIKDSEEKINLEEELEKLTEEKKEIINNGEAIKLAKDVIEKSYEKMKKNITPKFKNNLLKNKIGIIGEKYKNIIFNEEEGISVEIDNGDYVNANLLSVGTIDQLYLALRLATMEEISKETMPIILDESFAYYDDDRLENILQFLNNNFKKNQIIIFTCSKREKEILDKLKINYNFIEL